jgi:hypothetical protein
MEPSPAEHLSDLGPAQPRAHHLQTLHGIADQVRELVYGLPKSQKGVRPPFIDFRHPRVFDAELLLEKGQRLLQAVDLGLRPGPALAIGREGDS